MTSLLSSFSRLRLTTSRAIPSSSLLKSSTILSLSNSPPPLSLSPIGLGQVRHKSLVPRRTKYRKAHKGRIPLALGGSTKSTTLEHGDFGLRVNEPCRLSAKHLER